MLTGIKAPAELPTGEINMTAGVIQTISAAATAAIWFTTEAAAEGVRLTD